MPTVQANGIKLAYDLQGDPKGEPILLIAGLGLQLISWPDAFCKGLTDQGFRVIRFDNRDSGLSSKMDHFGKPDLHFAFFKTLFHMPLFSCYTLYDMAKDATCLLDELGIEKAHIVGASMGGMIAQIIAARYPHRALTLTSIMSTSGRPGLPGPALEANKALFSRPDNPRDINSVIDHFVKMFKVIGSPSYPTPEEELRMRVTASVRRNVSVSGTARQIMAVASSGDQGALLRTVKTPTLVIHGTDDPLVPVACGRDTARLVSGSILYEIEGMGHDFPPALDGVLSGLIAAHCKGELEPEARRA
ncbi:alpha/beta hydrolase [Noviherbaspirillum sp.]|uniref:alpha/beta fold hydrolase n=1 Tax=Noviherbaspirillum sp. TaxID=1926288 RepID=UPI002B47D111|nr:alpha/beta hydrolase [Noviherbaspirillum sp.]HJV82700.1 alpha/beta hydrolase [Noviherbaspirillum sp.]